MGAEEARGRGEVVVYSIWGGEVACRMLLLLLLLLLLLWVRVAR